MAGMLARCRNPSATRPTLAGLFGRNALYRALITFLIAAGAARPFIIVMTYGMTNDTQIGGLARFDIAPFETVLLRELVPYVDSHFRTLADPGHRALGGLSMGGFETKLIATRNPGAFSHIDRPARARWSGSARVRKWLST